MNPIYKFNNGRGATLCHLCRTIITTGKMTNDLYCDRCLSERVKIEEEFDAIHKSKRLEELKTIFTMKEFYEQMDAEVHFNRGNLNK
jgi:reverse gyrase